jgi:hypothetical protein
MAAWLHICPLCGWSREATSATVLGPRCERCSGLLEAAPAAAVASVHGQLGAVAPRLGPVYGRMLRFALVGLLLFAAGRFGWHAGGAGLALTGIGIVGLFTCPLIVPE